MRLRRLSVQNFRAFPQATLNLPEEGLVLVAGANNSGKSALLSGLDVIAGDSGDPSSVRHADAASGGRVNALFSLSEDERAEVLAKAADRDQLLTDGAAANLEFVFDEADEAQTARGLAGLGLTAIHGDWPGHGMRPFVQLRWEPGQSIVSTAQALTGGPRDTVGMTGTGTNNPSVWLDQLLPGWEDIRPFGPLLTGWRARYYHFRALRQGTQRTQNLASIQRLNPTGDNLGPVLLYLATDRPPLFRQLGELIAQIVPDIGQLQVRTAGGLRVVFESSHWDINLKDMGTGVEQLLMTLIVGLTEAPPFTLVIEEPETNLHPHAQRALLRMFQTWAADRLIVAATHSTVMLDWSPGGDRLWLVTRDHGASQVQPVDEDPLPLLRSLGVHLSDVLSADRLLVLEGPSDEDVLGTWFPELLRNPRVAILRGEGGNNARHADRLADWLTGADRAGLRRVLYLRDRDELPGPALAKLEASETVYVLRRRELENYLLDPDALAQVIGSLQPAPASTPTSDEIAALIQQTAESLRAKIIINRVCRRFAPPLPLMPDGLRKELANSAAGRDQIVAAVVERLMTPEGVRDQITELWAEAEADVTGTTGADLLAIAPGEEIIDAVFMHFAGRHYRKREDGEAIAKATPQPEEIRRVIGEFLAD